ncbi:MAG TPA: toll/interleukin-1 receptor domain-containing protein [Chitinophagaceae bacterium]|nr:toll/interleukin-1 receptor domain-containing protein [Chitinophagaceae bacterium]
MQLLDEIIIQRTKGQTASIQLLQGSLTEIPAAHASDILVISAYPGSYVPVPHSLIAGLYNNGIDVAAMAKHKEIDLREQLGCWLSAPLSKEQQERFHFRRILCYEPALRDNAQDTLVGNIFRCINTFAFNETNNVIAMPVLATGRQRVPMGKMLPAILDAGIFWLESGLPLTCMKLVLYSDAQTAEALPIFTRSKKQYALRNDVRSGQLPAAAALQQWNNNNSEAKPGEDTMEIVAAEIKEMAQQQVPIPRATALPDHTNFIRPPAPQAPVIPTAATAPAAQIEKPAATNVAATTNKATIEGYDYFVSYAHKHADVIDAFVQRLLQGNQQLSVFYDKTSIPTGGLWIKQISDAIQKSKKVLIFLSPDYSNSMVCWDEFQCAKLVEYNSKRQIIQTIYLYNDTAMPPIMGIYSWADCREGDKEKLEKIAAQLLQQLSS